jgi:outer membrane protein assembly factor BamB
MLFPPRRGISVSRRRAGVYNTGSDALPISDPRRDEAVPILTTCPFCETRFKVDSSLLGKQLRCPNATCREVFEVRDSEPPPEPVIDGVPVPAAPPSKSGHVGQMVPVVGAEVAKPVPPPPPDWRQGPPLRGRDAAPQPAPAAKPAPPPPTPPPPAARKTPRAKPAPGPVEMPPGTWEPPPVRRDSAPQPRRETTLQMEAATRSKKRRNTAMLLAIGSFCLVVLLGLGGAAWYLISESEDRQRAVAEDLYARKLFDQASAQYGKLVDKYPDSPRANEYRFLQDLCVVLALPSHSVRKDGGFDQVSTFLRERKSDPLFNDHVGEVGAALGQLLDDAAKRAGDNLGDAEAQAEFGRGREVAEELRALNRDAVPPEAIARAEAKKKEIDEAQQRLRDRLDLLARLRALAEKPTIATIRAFQATLRAEAAKPTRFDQDPEIQQAERDLYDRHRESIGFANDAPLVLGPRPAEDTDPGLLVQPLVASRADGPKLFPDRVVFALVRGVLYALSQADGETLWAVRVGIDTAHLPLRVPPSRSTPELALVLSADTLTLTAIDIHSTRTLWERRFDSACLGLPVLVDRKVFVPTLSGEVHEIEVDRGELLGRYRLGQSLSLGGARFGDSKQIFFPGDESCVYVVDVEKRSCQAVLYTDHEAGALRGEPILLPSEEDPAQPGYLVLSLAHGLDATLLRTFRLLPPNPNAAPGAPDSRLRSDPVAMPERRLRGWPWFPPYRDPEKLVTVTDAGVLGMFGIVQKDNKDDPLFPLVRLKDQEEGTVALTGQAAGRGRAQVVYARENDFWVLARGRLLHYTWNLGPAGPRVVPDTRWAQPLDLGSPLHESQADDDGQTVFLVTQALNGHSCLATAVDLDTGHVRWQRQLGLVCHGDPQPLGPAVVALDQGGGLFHFDPARHPANANALWQSGGLSLAGPLPDGASGSVHLVAGPDGLSVYEFACPNPGNRLIVRVHQTGTPNALEQVFDLPARLAGTPAVGSTRLLLPLADGASRQVRLPLGSSPVAGDGPQWRASRINAAAQGHAVWLGGEEFLITNGQRGLTRWQFRGDDTYAAIPNDATAAKPALELPDLVAGAPVVLSQTPLQVCIADERGTVHLLEGATLKPVRQWALPEPVTAGPFVRGDRLGCVVGRRRLVWLDPRLDRPLWTYVSPGEGIVGWPQLADGMLLVADVSGRFVGLDPATGEARGPGYRLRASVGPAAAPVGFGSGRAFAPLTDGTVLLLPLHHLREPLPGLPPVW